MPEAAELATSSFLSCFAQNRQVCLAWVQPLAQADLYLRAWHFSLQ